MPTSPCLLPSLLGPWNLTFHWMLREMAKRVTYWTHNSAYRITEDERRGFPLGDDPLDFVSSSLLVPKFLDFLRGRRGWRSSMAA